MHCSDSNGGSEPDSMTNIATYVQLFLVASPRRQIEHPQVNLFHNSCKSVEF